MIGQNFDDYLVSSPKQHMRKNTQQSVSCIFCGQKHMTAEFIFEFLLKEQLNLKTFIAKGQKISFSNSGINKVAMVKKCFATYVFIKLMFSKKAAKVEKIFTVN